MVCLALYQATSLGAQRRYEWRGVGGHNFSKWHYVIYEQLLSDTHWQLYSPISDLSAVTLTFILTEFEIDSDPTLNSTLSWTTLVQDQHTRKSGNGKRYLKLLLVKLFRFRLSLLSITQELPFYVPVNQVFMQILTPFSCCMTSFITVPLHQINNCEGFIVITAYFKYCISPFDWAGLK